MKLVAAHKEMKRSRQEKAFTHGAFVAGLGQDVPTLELLNLFTNGSGVVVSSFHLSLKLCDVLTVLLKGVAYGTLEVINDHEVWKETIINYNSTKKRASRASSLRANGAPCIRALVLTP